MRRPMLFVLVALVTLVILVVLASCVSGVDAPAPTDNPAPTSTSIPTDTPVPPSPTPEETAHDDHEEEDDHEEDADAIETGRTTYLSIGCSVCHGQDAEGSAIAPALPGHSADRVRRQVRTPMGKMPAFDEDQLSDEDMESLAAYIGNLQGEHAHEFELEAPEVTHHLMAIAAIKDGDLEDAIHHVEHAIEFIHEHEHEHQMEEATQLLEAGEAHEAEHLLEEMVGDLAEQNGEALAQLHLELALGSVRLQDAEGTEHHLTHFVEMASGMDKIKAQEALNLLAEGDMHEAGHIVEELTGLTPHAD